MNELALFAGCGGGILGGKLLGWETVCAVEINPYRARRLMQRQNEGHLSPFPIWDDVCTFDGKPWRGIIDVVSGGFPCQDISAAGNGDGLDGARSGLWVEMARIINEVRPKFAFVENSPMLTSRGLGRILGDLAEMGFDARWGSFTARNEGSPIERERLFIACTNKEHGETRMGAVTNWSGKVLKAIDRQCPEFWLQAAPRPAGVDYGMAAYMEPVSAIGDGQVPAVVASAWRILTHNVKVSARPLLGGAP
jgi:DNA (cytosine-5)-methyltransferase 1